MENLSASYFSDSLRDLAASSGLSDTVYRSMSQRGGLPSRGCWRAAESCQRAGGSFIPSEPVISDGSAWQQNCPAKQTVV